MSSETINEDEEFEADEEDGFEDDGFEDDDDADYTQPGHLNRCIHYYQHYYYI